MSPPIYSESASNDHAGGRFVVGAGSIESDRWPESLQRAAGTVYCVNNLFKGFHISYHKLSTYLSSFMLEQ